MMDKMFSTVLDLSKVSTKVSTIITIIIISFNLTEQALAALRLYISMLLLEAFFSSPYVF